MHEQSILPSELAVLLAFLFGPPLLVGWIGQFWFLRRRGLGAVRIFLSLLVTTATSIIAGVAAWMVSPRLPRVLGFQDLWIGHRWIPVLHLRSSWSR